MSGVEYHRIAELGHDGDGSHIDHEVVIAELRAAFRQQNPLIAGFAHLCDNLGHVSWSKKLGLFQVDRLSRPSGLRDEVRLAHKKRGDLEDVDNFAHGADLRRGMHIGEDRNCEFFPDTPEYGESLIESRPAVGVDRGPVGLVVRTLEHERDAQAGAGVL